jgi:DNA-binding transcriptional LysR family regulator
VLSRQIAAMEQELGIELFVREKKSVRLTQAGKIMEEGLTRLSREYGTVLERAMAAHLGFAGNLNIGIVEGQNISPPLSDALRAFHRKFPDIRLNPSRHTMNNLRSALINRQIDAGFTAKFVVDEAKQLEYREVGTVKTMLCVPKSHPMAGKENLTLADFKNDRFLTLPEEESRHVARIAEGMKAQNIRTLLAPDIGTLALWLEAGYGIATMSENHALRHHPDFLFLSLPELGDVVEVIAWRRGHTNPMLASFIDEFPDLKPQDNARNL